METFVLYLLTWGSSCGVTAVVLYLANRFLSPFLLDTPYGLKKHQKPVPVIGGIGIFIGTLFSLTLIRLLTNFPTGTLHSLRGIFVGGTLIFVLGLLDDLRKPKGVSIPVKLAVQALAAGSLIYYGGGILVFHEPFLNWLFSFLWLVGLTNAFNLLDIMDGLCVSQAVICTLGLIFIALPSEFLYVNFAALALLGSCLCFWPHNHAKNKFFLGDSGSTFLGFMLAALSMGTAYSAHVSSGFLAPLLILAVPLYDTGFVSLARILQGKNPLKGSADHLALRLQRAGHTPLRILCEMGAFAFGLNILAYILTRCSWQTAGMLFCLIGILAMILTQKLLKLP